MGVIGLSLPITVRSEKKQKVIVPESFGNVRGENFPELMKKMKYKDIRISTEYPGRLIHEENGDGVRIEFRELDGDLNRIMWHERDPGVVYYHYGDAMMVYDLARKWVCINSGMLGPIEVRTNTLELSNAISSGGDLRLKYRVELHTVPVEETEQVISISSRPAN